MKTYDYLIIGGGMTADAAVKGIREKDTKGTIAIVSDETDAPYSRPPLSKGLWNGKKKVEEIDCGTADHDVTMLLGRKVTEIRNSDRCVVDSENETHGYGRLLLATGGSPCQLPNADGAVIYYRTLADYHMLAAHAEERKDYAIVGGGFIGSELAAALTGAGKSVTMIYPEDMLGAGVFPDDVARSLSQYYDDQGVQMMNGLKLSDLEAGGKKYTLHLENGRTLEMDGVIAGIGIEPNTKLAENAGLNVDDGIVVDAQLMTSDDSIYAAGDVANFYNPALDRRMRVEHEDNALTMGQMAGRNMAGAEEEYTHLPYFYSDLFDVGYEAVGELDSRLETIGIWEELHAKGIWAYVSEGGNIRGVLLWNMFGQTDAARLLIDSGKSMAHNAIRDQLRKIVDEA